MNPDEIQARLLYRDALMLILDKPAGLPVHAGPKGGENLEQYFEHLRFGLPRPPALAHRLDRDTSGCLVLGRHKQALKRLGKLFADGRVKKIYWAVVQGAPPESEGRIDLALRKRSTEKRGWWMEPGDDGQTAVTDYRVLGQGEGVSWLELRPHTGRTHQIRVHCQALGCPIVGDPVYGLEKPPSRPLHLHARAISVPLYSSREPVTAAAELPEHMVGLLKVCGWNASASAACI